MLNTKFPGAEYLSETKDSTKQDSEIKIEHLKIIGLPPSEQGSADNNERNSYAMSPTTEHGSQGGQISMNVEQMQFSENKITQDSQNDLKR